MVRQAHPERKRSIVAHPELVVRQLAMSGSPFIPSLSKDAGLDAKQGFIAALRKNRQSWYENC